ncbi:cytoplasmic polyadenylation element-binding protein 3 isoform X1 [Dermacentor silvarum]|uniref:cytoplasmic polyadenylation element-binding protein 3 isoform X1 n=2 Tax=Dermacentor silvarum TaxID=543639 RepID=UPI00189AA058|nr:cytoplasmic polyadenylation element-binding protein 3 isoform X1 [Dermacentor silvarum]
MCYRQQGRMVGSEDEAAPNWDGAAVGGTTSKGGGGGGKRRGANGAWSPRNCLLVRDFLVPCLDSRCYGDDLQWLNRRRGVFLIRWTHQGSKSFNREGPNVFRDWSILKRKWDDRDPNRLSKAKQRVRAAFRKLPNVRRINDGAAPHRIYRIKDIGTYLKPWKEPKEKKKRKKRRSCGCLPGCSTCKHQEQRVQSPAGVDDDDDDEDLDELYEDYEEAYPSSNAGKKSRSTPSSTSSSSGVWSSLHSLTEASTPPEEEEQEGATSSCASWGPDDMEAVQALLSIRHGYHQPFSLPPQQQLQQPAMDPPAPTAAVTPASSVPTMQAHQEDQVVPMELAMASPVPSAEDEASLAPHSVHVFKEQLAAALATAPRPAQPDTGTGDSPHMFWADAAPARQGEQLASAAVGDSGFVSGFGSKPIKSEQSAESAAGGATAAMAGTTTAPSGWTDHTASSSWLDRNEPTRPDGCWSTR